MLGREIKRGDIVAAIGAGPYGAKMILLNVTDVADWAVLTEHRTDDDACMSGVFTQPQSLVIVHEADEPYPINAPQPDERGHLQWMLDGQSKIMK